MSADAVRAVLLELHREILRAERVTLERIHGRMGAAEFLQVAADDPKLAWLVPLSELVVAFDEEDADAKALVGRARGLLTPPDPATPFGRRHLSLLQRSPEIVMAHRAAGEALARYPDPERGVAQPG